ncbi:MAG TPA: iron-sulfur cluster assembly protein, partial [Planctomycetota bacterium]|nr:iron-sulfur cluster assembly protein [Planctomycetota bacterium]
MGRAIIAVLDLHLGPHDAAASMINPFRKTDATTSTEPTKDDITAALRNVMEPELHKDIVTLNMVKNVAVCAGVAKVTIELTTPACPLKKEIEDSARAAVLRVPGMKELNVEFTANVTSRMGVDRPSIAGIKNVIAVTSGKG